MITTVDIVFNNDDNVKSESIIMLTMMRANLMFKSFKFTISTTIWERRAIYWFLNLFMDGDFISKSSKVYEWMPYEVHDFILCFLLMLFFIDSLTL